MKRKLFGLLFFFLAIFVFSQNSYPEGDELIFYCMQGDVVNIRRLLAKDVNVNYQNDNGFTALMHAAQRNNFEIVNLLINVGAKVNIQNNAGISAHMLATGFGYYEMLKLLLDKGANVNTTSSLGTTALMSAVSNGHTDIVRLLLERNADVNIENFIGATALQMAITRNSLGLGGSEIITMLRRAGAR